MNKEFCSLFKRSRSRVKDGKTVLFVDMSVDIHRARTEHHPSMGEEEDESKRKLLLWQFYYRSPAQARNKDKAF